MPDAAGGEGGHGVANPDRVIHRCISNPKVMSGNARWFLQSGVLPLVELGRIMASFNFFQEPRYHALSEDLSFPV